MARVAFARTPQSPADAGGFSHAIDLDRFQGAAISVHQALHTPQGGAAALLLCVRLRPGPLAAALLF